MNDFVFTYSATGAETACELPYGVNYSVAAESSKPCKGTHHVDSAKATTVASCHKTTALSCIIEVASRTAAMRPGKEKKK